MTGFNSLVEKKKAITFPEKPLNLRSRSAAEEKEGIGNKERFVIALFNDCSKRINTISEIGESAYDVDITKVTGLGIFKYIAPPL